MIDLVWGISSLDASQKKLVKEVLLKELDDGGVSRFEYKEAIRRLNLNRVELGLSSVDIKNLRKAL